MLKTILKECGKVAFRAVISSVVTIGTFAVIGELVNIKEQSENSKEDKNEEK